MSVVTLRILGIVSNELIPVVETGFRRKPTGDNYLDFFCAYSDFDIALGTKFCVAKSKDYQERIVIKLIDVTQQWGIPYDGIPAGHKTICRFDVADHDIDIFYKLCGIAKSWDDNGKSLEIESCY